MLYIALGVLGFVVAYVFDLASLKNIRGAKQLAGLIAFALLIYSTVMICRNPIKFDIPVFSRIIGAGLLAVSLSLLIYSLFIELSFAGTYFNQGVSGKLVSTGTYALVRHPGVIWLAFVFTALGLLYPSTTLFIAVAVWWLVDVIYVAIQDKYLFPKMFPEYPGYKKQTPFLIPTRRSFLACLKTLRLPIVQRN
jgi:protein-S-isoprenylcysteine O-methyltransferase Ste14